jgi:glycosyltransferase involved in cell wall biosynthesis
MNKRNIVSVVIVTFNADKTLQRCLESIYNQSCHAIEIIVIDGGSTDTTVQILQKNEQSITFWRSEPDEGIYDAMNKAVSHITTNWVLFLGSDDTLLPDFSNMVLELQDTKCIYYANVLYKGAKHSGNTTAYHQAKLGIFHQSIIYPSSVFQKYSYHLKYKIAADYALNMRLHSDNNYKFVYKSYVIADYNDTGISASVRDDAFEGDKSQLIYECFGLNIWLRYTFRVLRSKLKLKKNA